MERLDKYSSSAVNLMKACCLIGVVAIHSDPMLYHYESRQGLELLAFILEQLQYVCVPFFLCYRVIYFFTTCRALISRQSVGNGSRG